MRHKTVIETEAPLRDLRKRKRFLRCVQVEGSPDRVQLEGEGLNSEIEITKLGRLAGKHVVNELYLSGRAHFLCDETLEAAIREAVHD